MLLTALALLLFGRALRGERRALWWWSLAAALALATHYFALFVVVPQALWLLGRDRSRRTAAAVAVPGVAGLALLPLALHQRSNEGAAFIEGSDLAFRLAQVPKQFLVAFDAPAEAAVTAAAAVLAAAGLLMLARSPSRPEQRGAAVAGAIGVAGVLLPAILAAAGVDYVLTRNLIAALVPLLVVLAAGFASPWIQPLGTALTVALCALWATLVLWVAAEPEFHRQDWRGAAEALGPATADRIVVATPVNGRQPLQVYLPGARLLRYDQVPTVREVAYLGLVRRAPGEEAVPPFEPAPDAPGLAGFRLVERERGEQFLVLRYRGPDPQPAPLPGVARFKLAEDLPVIFEQPAP